jgi:membrane-bound serine protease (ClpP class)
MNTRICLLCLLCLLFAGLSSGAWAGDVLVARMDGIIGPSSAKYMAHSIDRAERAKAECIVFEMDTPGGLEESMRTIVKKIMSSRVPVVVYVAPSGSRAASAGVFITLAAHVAAMAPGTNIGAAHPVALGVSGKMDSIMAGKAVNDAAAYIRSLAEKRGRNAKWADEAVRKSVSISETEALKLRVIDLIEPSTEALLEAIDGRAAAIGPDSVVMKTKGARIVGLEMGWSDRLLAVITNPNIAYILFMLGLLGLYFELSTPGAILPGVTGAICLILAFFAFQALSVNYAGMLLIILAVVLFIVDVKAATHGALTVGGLVAMTIGSIMLFNDPDPALHASLKVIIPVLLVTGAFFAIGVVLSIRALRRRPSSGGVALVDQEGDARTIVSRNGGRVFVAGTHWTAVSDAEIPEGRKIRVVAVKGMTLKVEEVK